MTHAFNCFFRSTHWLALACFALSFIACNNHKGSINSIDADIAIAFVRYDQELNHAVDHGEVNTLIEAYPLFSEVYAQQVLRSPREGNRSDSVILTDFVLNPYVQKLYDTVQFILGDLSQVEMDFEKALSHYHRLFPEDSIPRIMTYVSEFGIGAFTIGDRIIGLGLDFYLGSDFPYPGYNAFPGYVRHSMNIDHLVMRGMQALLESKVPHPRADRMVDIICRNGKILYLLDQVLPFEPDSVVFDYSQKELEWCLDNEQNIWTFFWEEELIYETNLKRIQKYVGLAPHSSGMPDDAPGRTANWIGYQIVKKLMEKENLSIAELLAIEDGQEILNRARYKGN